ncbi:bifunctional [glutamine synthetase] adenylyltransferase/[glutamine synthetase]-adenylyl-L-tyrosine phosphorylase [Dietzia lutea]|uniref:Bifunctional glutamine synthetase adenylyltransferase/adenylyl-removing enzyme n=2 Tax=Dietzia lutea TaxID=546160 RepID=A0A2S1RC07_9ACTN|nr:bifunctional [glutamine synthetase] adenylyltransferase/[glutamine synthetase]-adenylyl-L-tyrosine phosphorylase [Dietzia lutea]AWH93792.1 bifunctional glutamine-synthetase adenylyltransferase/deadenyltransferase [Dietzia lutea]
MVSRDSSRPRLPSPGRLGLLDDRAADWLDYLGWNDDDAVPVLWALSRAPDPDLALGALVRLRESLVAAGDGAGTAGDGTAGDGSGVAALDSALLSDARLRARLFGLLGSSSALGDHLVAEPTRWPLLRAELPSPREVAAAMLGAVEAVPEEPVEGAPEPTQRDDLCAVGTYRAGITGGAAVKVLRSTYRDQVALLAAHDVAAAVEDEEPRLPFADVGRRLSDLADAALTAALAVAVATVYPDGPMPSRLGVVAMGKGGARELNYISDVDVIFVAEPADAKTGRVAGEMMRIGSMAFFEVDAALRPEGKSGELVRTVDSHAAYYRRWAKTWEFQALLKARPMTGDMALATEYHDIVHPMVWTAAERDDFVHDVQAMRRRVEENVPEALRERELKLGRGGLRDVEFAVQLLQMVHGRTDEDLRVTSTVDALAALRDGGYIAREDGAELVAAYEFLRLLEHRLQLQRYKRTHLFPEDDDEEAYRWLARAAHIRPNGPNDAAQVLRQSLRQLRRRVRRLHSKLFYRPLLDSIASYDAEALSLSPQAMERQLAALGFGAPRNALGHLRALAGQSSRRGRIQALLLPTFMEWLADTPDPDAGLLAYRRLCEENEEVTWFLRTLRDDSIVARRLVRVLGTSAFVAGLLMRNPEVIPDLTDGAEGPVLVASKVSDIASALTASAARHPTPERVIAAARSLRRAELARIGAADVLGMISVPDVGRRLTAVWRAVLEASLAAVVRDMMPADGRAPARIAYIGMGRLGGDELSYGSDADVMIVCEPTDGTGEDEAVRWATQVAERVGRLLSSPSSDPPLDLDADLRPEGRNGPLVRTLASYRAYYSTWADTWELQALLRASFAAGDRDLGLDFLHMIDVFRYPEDGVPPKVVQEIRRMKARIDSERLPRGADPATHTKLGRGGLADVEWCAQLLTMQHAARVPGLHTTSTLEALDAAASAELVSEGERDALVQSWLMAGHARNALVLARGKAVDQLPGQGKILAAVAMICTGRADGAEFLNEYLRVTRHGRRAVDRVFWGED